MPPPIITTLVQQRYDQNRESYIASAYNETQHR